MPERLAYAALLLGSVLVLGACSADGAAEDGGTDTTTSSGEVERADAPRPTAAPNAAMQAVLDEAILAQQWAADALKRAFGIVAAWERRGGAGICLTGLGS